MSKEFVFDWKPIEGKSLLGNISRPVVKMEIKAASGEWKIFYPEVDSGAVVSVFNKSDCELLGYVLTGGEYFPISGVLGESRDGYVHTLDVRIGDTIFKSRIVFTEGKNHKHLLGRVDVFDNFIITIRGRILKTIFVKE